MHFNHLEQFKPRPGERYIIVEAGEPKAVVINYEDYQMIMGDDEYDGMVPMEASMPSPLEGSETKEDHEFPFDMPDFLEETEPMKNMADDMEEELEPVDVGPQEAEINEPVIEPEQHEEEKREKVEDLKNELKRELTLDDLPF